MSTDPKTMVDNIPLGPKAVVVRVVRVFVEDGDLWRPNDKLFYIGDALDEKIPWPDHKIVMTNTAADNEELLSKSRSNAVKHLLIP